MNLSNSKRYFQRKLRDRRGEFWRKNIVTILLNFLNVVLISVTVFYNFFRVSEHFEARMTWAWTDPGPELNNDMFTAKIAIFNTGNRQALLTKMALTQINVKDGAYSSWGGSGITLAKPELPIVVEPNHIALIQLTTPVVITDWYLNSHQCDSSLTLSPDTKARCVNLGISWAAVNAEGQSFNGLAIIANINVDSTATTGIAVFSNVIDLFHNFYGN
jgi:hypothetical protein